MSAHDSAEELKRYNIKCWNDLLSHNFILEMAADSLPIEKFAYYLRQDQIFLKEYCAFLLVAKQRSTDEKLKILFDSLYQSIIDYEMKMQRELLLLLEEISNIDYNNYESTIASATLNYISFIRQVSSLSDNKNLEEVMISVMAPCPWSYLEITQKLSKSDVKRGNIYSKWIQFYSSHEAKQQLKELKNILSRMYDRADNGKKMNMKQYFGAACKHEYKFWEAAYNMR
jgi:thiaminase (transcriptional activator TenA)